MAPGVSVILRCYNVSSFPDRSIGSVLRQTRPIFEVIAADDCSTDDTVACLETFGPPVQVIRGVRNEGPAPRRNDAIREAIGEYIALLDPEDGCPEGHEVRGWGSELGCGCPILC